MSYIFEAPPDGPPLAVTIQFDGQRRQANDVPAAPERFSVRETIPHLPPGSGRTSVTARVTDINAGQWDVTASHVDPVNGHRLTEPTVAAGSTTFAPLVLARAPGARLGAWPALVALGAIVAIVVQLLLAIQANLPSSLVLALSATACVIGLICARVYFVTEHPQGPRSLMNITTGLCVQGFVLGATTTITLGALLLGLPLGTLLDSTAPGLLFGMGIGRLGCLLGGCCAGRPTSSRWGVWSSDRRIGIRRIPTQLIEAAIALAIGWAALAAVLARASLPSGWIFASAIAAYTLGRQVVFPLRSLPRRTRLGRFVAAATSLLVLISAAYFALHG